MAKGFNSRGMGGMGGNMNSMLRQAQKMQQDLMKAQEGLGSKAYEAGAGGGTVIPSRNIANEKVKGFWGSGFQEEKDIVLIVSDSDSKLAIMQAIGDKCGMHSDAKGMIISLPIDSVIGF